MNKNKVEFYQIKCSMGLCVRGGELMVTPNSLINFTQQSLTAANAGMVFKQSSLSRTIYLCPAISHRTLTKHM